MSKQNPAPDFADIGYGVDSDWTQMRIRKYYRDYLRDLGKLNPLIKGRGKYSEPRPMNQVFETLVEDMGARLVHKDMGTSFTHTPDPYCGCGPEWPASDE